MRNWLLAPALAAAVLSGCGSNTKPTDAANGVAAVKTTASVVPTAKSTSPTTTPATKPPAKPAVTVKGTYVQPAKQLKTPSGKAPAVVLLPDTGNSGSATAESKKLAKLGVGSLVVPGPRNAPTDPKAFGAAVRTAIAAVRQLRSQPGVDPRMVGIVGEGVGAHVGAVAVGTIPGEVSAAALADIGGVVVPSPKYAPDRWLKKASGIQLLFQRDLGARAMTQKEATRLILVSPPGTLMQQYKDLGAAAQAARDTWILQKLLAG